MESRCLTEMGQTPSRKYLWRRVAWSVLALLTLPLGVIVWQATAFTLNWNAYSDEAQRQENILCTSLRERRPPNISQEEWEHSVNCAVIARLNVFAGPDYASFQSLKEFGKKLDDKMEGEIDPSIFDWIWDQYEQTGPHGKQYARHFRPMFREGVEAIRKRQP
jgi:hypothetical protein